MKNTHTNVRSFCYTNQIFRLKLTLISTICSCSVNNLPQAAPEGAFRAQMTPWVERSMVMWSRSLRASAAAASAKSSPDEA